MITYPVLFQAKAKSLSGIQTGWEVESQGITISCAVPPEFEGPGGALSPEDLFVQSLANCFIATFKVYAEKSKLGFEHLSLSADLVVDRDDTKQPRMKSCVLRVEITGCTDIDRIRVIAQKAFTSGFILNSVKTELTLEIHAS